MMEAKHRIRSWAARSTVAAIVASVSVSAAAFPGGTIQFIGALFAPPFDVGMTTASRSASFAALSQSGKNAAGEDAALVEFVAPPNSAPRANVRVETGEGAQTPDAIKTRFVDGHGKLSAPDANGAYRLDASGGLFSVKGKSGGTMTIVTEYP